MILYCHGNLRPENVIFDPVTKAVVFIDLKYAGPNFQVQYFNLELRRLINIAYITILQPGFLLQAYELAQHFMSLAGPDLSRVGRSEYVPAKEFQIRWLRHYFSAFKVVPEAKVYYAKWAFVNWFSN